MAMTLAPGIGCFCSLVTIPFKAPVVTPWPNAGLVVHSTATAAATRAKVRVLRRPIRFKTHFIESLQALNVRSFPDPAPCRRMSKTEGPTILSVSYGSVNGRNVETLDGANKKGGSPLGKPPCFTKTC